jgi:predicted HicB family RNase H-like nuclease
MQKTKQVKYNEDLYRAEDYSYSVTWSEEDKLFIGKVSEFESLAAHADTPVLALEEITGVVRFVLDDLKESGEPIPEPFSKKSFSGKLMVRMATSLHRNLALEAAKQGVSLNALITQKLCGV